jgi:SAM-dependent methyltransferase
MESAVNYNRYQYDFIWKEIGKIDKNIKKVLDFGAGIGTYADMFKNSGITIDCVEPDPNQAEILKQKGYRVYKNVKEVKAKYDVVYSLNVLEHIKDDGEALTGIKSCLSSKGVIVIYVPALMILFTKLDVLVEHFRRYRIKDMRLLAQKNNLKLKSAQYCDPVGFTAALTYRVIGGSGNLKPRSINIFDKYLFPIGVSLEPLTKRLFGKNILAVFSK